MAQVQNTQNEDKGNLAQKYKQRGYQQLTLAEYDALKKKKAKKFRIPTHLKIILVTPLLLICSIGIFFIPYSLYMIAIGKPPPEVKAPDIKWSQLLKDKDPNWGKKKTKSVFKKKR